MRRSAGLSRRTPNHKLLAIDRRRTRPGRGDRLRLAFGPWNRNAAGVHHRVFAGKGRRATGCRRTLYSASTADAKLKRPQARFPWLAAMAGQQKSVLPANFLDVISNLIPDVHKQAAASWSRAERAAKREAKNRHYRQCNIDRGISPKSFYRTQEQNR